MEEHALVVGRFELGGDGFHRYSLLRPRRSGARVFDPPEFADSPEQDVASVRLLIPRDQISAVMGPGIMEIFAALGAQGIAPAGPWLTHHFRVDPEVFDFEICVPVTRPVAESGRVKPGKLRATRVVRALMRGGYEQLGPTWGAFMAWIDEQGVQKAGDVWEIYAVGPESGPDAAQYRTILNVAVRE